MNVISNIESDEYPSEANTSILLASQSGDRLVVTISPIGLTVIQAEKSDLSSTLGSIVVIGLTPQQAAIKSKGFWGKLWDKIKKAAEDVIDAFTFEAGPLTCRPHAKVDFQDDKLISITVGLNCQD